MTLATVPAALPRERVSLSRPAPALAGRTKGGAEPKPPPKTLRLLALGHHCSGFQSSPSAGECGMLGAQGRAVSVPRSHRRPKRPLVLTRAAELPGLGRWRAGSCLGGRGGPTLPGSPEARREGLCLPKHKSQATSSGGAQGRAGKPQFITKMENDTSLHASPGEGLIYDCARAWDIRQRGATCTPSAGALIAVLLATGVKDALWIGYLLLFIIKARQPSSGADRRHDRREPMLGPCPPGLPSLIPTTHPSLPRHLSLFTSQPLGGVGGNSWGPRPLPRPAPLIFMENLLSAWLCLW